MQGKVDWFNKLKRFGFIIGNDGKKYFLHVSQFQGSLNNGDEVSFDPVKSDRGMQVHNVKKEATG